MNLKCPHHPRTVYPNENNSVCIVAITAPQLWLSKLSVIYKLRICEVKILQIISVCFCVASKAA